MANIFSSTLFLFAVDLQVTGQGQMSKFLFAVDSDKTFKTSVY